MAEDGFPLPGSSFKELCKIIAAYSETAGPSSPSDVSKLIGIHDTQVSRSNKFLVAIGIVEGGQKKKCTLLGNKLGRAIHFEEAVPTQEAWREVYIATDFLHKIVSSIRIRKGMEESALVSHIAFTSGNSKNNAAMAGAAAVIEILKSSGAVAEEGGTLVAVDLNSAASKVSSVEIVHLPKEEDVRREQINRQTHDELPREWNAGSLTSLNINLTISCTADQLEGLGSKLRVLQQEFEGISETEVKLQAPETEAGDSATSV